MHKKKSFKFEHFESLHKSLVWHCHTLTRVFNQTTKHWVQFLLLDLYCCQNWQELLQKRHFHLHIIQFINAMEMTINLANKRNSPGSRADDIRWVRPWRICGAWRTSGVHQVKSATNLDCNKYPTLTPDKSAMPVSTNPPLPPSESSTSKYFLKDFRKIWTKVSRFAYLWLCVFLRLSELPNFGSLKIFQ